MEQKSKTKGAVFITAETLYKRLVSVINVPVIETSDIWTKGIFIKERGTEAKIYIKQGLEPPEKLMVLLHEYTHYLHMEKYFEQENRAESEIIAESTVFFVLREFGLALPEEPVLTEFTEDTEKIKHLSFKIQQISGEIITMLK